MSTSSTSLTTNNVGKEARTSQRTEKLLAIPGPIELSPSVQHTLSLAPLSHVSPEFVQIMQETLSLTRQVARTNTTSQVFVLTGSGTLGWEQVGANLVVNEGEEVLVMETGYFGVGFRECLQSYGANVTTLKASRIGSPISPSELAAHLQSRQTPYKMVTITHVDTSTGVLADVKGLSEVIKSFNPETLVVVDAVCSLASEELEMDKWGLDVVFSASQKGLGAPPGLSILLASPRAIKKFESKKQSIGGFYASWKKWLPIMRAYDNGTPAYFGTPAVTLVRGYHTSLLEIIRGGLEARLKAHRIASSKFKQTVQSLGLSQVAFQAGAQANGMTAIYVPNAKQVVGEMSRRGVVIAGGLIPGLEYVRIGHMGWSVMGGADDGRGVEDVLSVFRSAVSANTSRL